MPAAQRRFIPARQRRDDPGLKPDFRPNRAQDRGAFDLRLSRVKLAHPAREGGGEQPGLVVVRVGGASLQERFGSVILPSERNQCARPVDGDGPGQLPVAARVNPCEFIQCGLGAACCEFGGSGRQPQARAIGCLIGWQGLSGIPERVGRFRPPSQLGLGKAQAVPGNGPVQSGGPVEPGLRLQQDALGIPGHPGPAGLDRIAFDNGQRRALPFPVQPALLDEFLGHGRGKGQGRVGPNLHQQGKDQAGDQHGRWLTGFRWCAATGQCPARATSGDPRP
ncbi:hypothetical protein U4960_00720 [Altererythrobacter sp. H2]|uniref:hypothetical protein n=1 Tax=Altererythrobacter sp. H2 TaxID=3108391 RepID=UPI002B4BEE6C|nr:hypothetical protein [Altererythrobacter sp. H2]WRK95886.1 hypothetical protein U4960_00720 [Altererythrobacter sp. H2]